jgi:hypothetical protein
MALFTFVTSPMISFYTKLILQVILFFAFLHLFVCVTETKLTSGFGLDAECCNVQLCSFVLLVLLSILFTDFVLRYIVLIVSEEEPRPSSSTLNQQLV